MIYFAQVHSKYISGRKHSGVLFMIRKTQNVNCSDTEVSLAAGLCAKSNTACDSKKSK